MTISDISKIRLASQGISGAGFKSVKHCVEHMGAMQAQDFNMCKWALGIRVKNATNYSVNKALDKGDALRTHVLRPTWHLVSAKNIYWMLELTGPKIRSLMKSRDKQLGLTDKVYNKSLSIIEKAFKQETDLTRDEIVLALNNAKLKTNDSRSLHFLMNAELNGLICSGASKDSKNTYALLEERVKKTAPLDREEAIIKLADIYFKSHSPATLSDFAWWSGLTLTDVNKVLPALKKNFTELSIKDQVFLVDENMMNETKKKSSLFLLPAFDELIISYRDRTAIITADHHSKAISTNGIFNPAITLNGHVIGLWKRDVVKDNVLIEVNLFSPQKDIVIKKIKSEAGLFAEFIEKQPIVNFTATKK